ncbi:MAG: hypothetical protein WC140_03170 [Bacteroidales bacterium]
MKLEKIFCFIGFIFISLSVYSQFYSLGNDPHRTKWRILKTENYDFIYPAETDSLSRIYATNMENWREKIMEPLKISPKKLPVIIHPYNSISNGLVSWAPKRILFFTTPPAYEGSAEVWHKNLVIHESRHVGQCEHFTTGIYKYANYIFGEQISGLALGLYPSKLFLEGDAVISETDLTNASRSNTAKFTQYLRTAYLHGDYRTFYRYYFGSNKYFTPNVYVMGYQLNAMYRYDSDNYFFPSDYYKNLINYWYSLKHNSNFYKQPNSKNWYENFRLGQKVLTNIWKKDAASRGEFTRPNILHKVSRFYTDYYSPTLVNDKENSIYALKYGMENTTTLIRLDSLGKEHYIRPFNNTSSDLIYNHNNRIYWTECVYNGLFSLENFSCIRYYDINSKITHSLTSNTRYFNVAISKDSQTLATIEYPIKGSSFLVFLDANTSKVKKRINAPINGKLQEITYLNGIIYSTIVTDQGMGIYKYDKKWERVSPLTYKSISHLKSANNHLIFTSDLDGLQNIYSYNPTIKKLFRLTNSKYGAEYPIFGKGFLIYSDYHYLGYRISKIDSSIIKPQKANFLSPYKDPVYTKLKKQEKIFSKVKVDTNDFTDSKKYPSKKYNKTSHFFRIHSWAPFYYNVDKIKSISFDELYELGGLGATVYSQNSLGTAVSMLGYCYHNGHNSGHMSFSYTGFGPVFEIKADINDRNRYSAEILHENNTYRLHIYDTSTPYVNTLARIYLPYNFSRGGWSKGFIPELGWEFDNDKYNSLENLGHYYKNSMYLSARYYQTLPISLSGIFPRFGISTQTAIEVTPFDGGNYGNKLYSKLITYLPGITHQQGLKLTISLEKDINNHYTYFTRFLFSGVRGNDIPIYSDMAVKYSADYAASIYLGDRYFCKLLYLKRLKLIPFVDYATYKQKEYHKSYYSFGSDFLVDFYPLGYHLPLSLGFRYARTNQTYNMNYFSFLFQILL